MNGANKPIALADDLCHCTRDNWGAACYVIELLLMNSKESAVVSLQDKMFKCKLICSYHSSIWKAVIVFLLK